MNPFTQSLLTRLGAHQITEFIAQWDVLEGLVIRVFRAKGASPADEADYAQTHAWLRAHYGDWRAALAQYWPQAKVAGASATEDPFEKLLAPGPAAAFVGNWPALQALPAARESLNRLILDLQQD